MTIHRVGDAAAGVGLFLYLAWVYGMFDHSYPTAGILIFFTTLVTFRTVGLYRSWRVAILRHEIHQIILGCVAVFIILLLAGYSLKVSDLFSRRVVLTWMLTWPVLLGMERLVIRTILRRYREKGYNIRRTVIAGAGDLGERLTRWLDENPWSGAKVIGFFDDKRTDHINGYPVLGPLEELPAFARKGEVDMIYVALPMRAEEKIQWLLKELADTTASVYLVPDIFLFDLLLGGSVMYFDSIPVIALRDTPLRGFNGLLKRAEDLVFASLILLVVSPIILAIAIAIKLTSPGPVLFKQWRYGLDGQPISIYKFRTMIVCEDGYSFKQATQDDPRVTRLGALLRRTSLDELPQFINVLQGRMSIVGPRPHPVAMNEEYRKLVPGYMLRHKVRPGITGLAQVRGWRGETETIDKMEKRVEYDLEYLRQWTLLLDLKIIALTLVSSVWKNNAY
jgi:putative colanic acid biosynthesis UDP-glucose lipid carrier transferase